MTPQAVSLKSRRTGMQAGAVHFHGPPYTISDGVEVQAETRRLFQAVVVPEYLETWLRIPEDNASLVVTPLKPAAGFVLNWRYPNATQARILALFKTCRRRKLSICWKLEIDDVIQESVVVMRLSGDFGKSILSLFHSGFASFDDFVWHRQLWNESLKRLAKLF